MRPALSAAAALFLAIALAGSPAAAAPHDTPQSVNARAVSAAAYKLNHPRTLPAQGPDDVCYYTNRRPNLHRGSSGRAVAQLQCYLNAAIDAGLDEDGSFGGVTRGAVRDFQICADITVDGRVGAQTWSFLSFWANSTDAPFSC
ncbi:peptidoglycan-binding protein [Streptomyces sp. NPDC001401]|uniref:peptidoglycan-binding domain-containing protein n=1 Tax=Streptomyces sp. NPDC001401 TaxID=3364570 RepID=UPI0036CBFA2E